MIGQLYTIIALTLTNNYVISVLGRNAVDVTPMPAYIFMHVYNGGSPACMHVRYTVTIEEKRFSPPVAARAATSYTSTRF